MEISNINHPEANNFPVKPSFLSSFLGFLKNGLVFVFLLLVIVGSFWVSFKLGTRILFPAHKDNDQIIQVEIPAAPAAIANLQKDAVVPVVKPAAQAVAKSGLYKVVAGKFNSRSQSMNLVDKLNQSGFATYLKKVGNQWWVQAGAFMYENQALSLKKNLSTKGFSSSLIFEQK